MSHVVDIDTQITDLASLKKACEELGLEFVENSKRYSWFGRFVGDYPMPKGFTKEMLGKCDHEIRLNGCEYSIGVVKLKDGTHTLAFDFWGEGMKLKKTLGDGLHKLVDRYGVNVAKAQAKRKGYICKEKTINGAIHLTISC